ncbi:MAG: capsule assembly Wzi family protein [Terracidiphilus sp.]|nr:capsule assembly Wzi family protein [Terracidiphilus sp.]
MASRSARRFALVVAAIPLIAARVGAVAQSRPDPGRPAFPCEPSRLGSPYIPVDSWVYPAMLRLYSLGFVDTMYLDMRPWTRASVSNMVDEAGGRIDDADPGPATDEAEAIYESLLRELHPDIEGPCLNAQGNSRLETVYTVARGISGTPLHDSFHLGQTIINDYGRPYENGFNSYSGASGSLSAGRFFLYARGEFEAAPSATGYGTALAQTLSNIDRIPFINPATGLPYYQATIPRGPLNSIARGRWIEAYVGAQVLHHAISLGKQDEWLGPGLGGGMAYSNNAENMYSFRINRTEPLHVPGLSYVTGPFRYEFMVGVMQGHTEVPNPLYPAPRQANVITAGNPWFHLEKISFRPTENLEFGFERSVIWGGKGHAPVTLHTFLKSFFSLSSPATSVKLGREDPGARFGAFDFSYRLPYLRRWLTLYTDAEVHDDISPIDAPRRAAWRPGIYLSHIPGIPSLDLRVEAVTTDPPVSTSNGGVFMYYESIERQGYTNQGNLIGDWIGREGKGGQAWLTYHLSGNEWLQFHTRNQKVAKDFVPGGTTLNDFGVQVVKRVGRTFEINADFTAERWKAPVYPTGIATYPAPEHSVTSTTVQLTWFPQRKVSF